MSGVLVIGDGNIRGGEGVGVVLGGRGCRLALYSDVQRDSRRKERPSAFIFGAISPAACGALITMTMATIRRQTTEEPIRAVRGRR